MIIKLLKDNLFLVFLFLAIISFMLMMAFFNSFQDTSATNTSAQQKEGTTTISIENATIEAEMAETPEARQQGLSGRSELDENAGMLFVFPEADRHGIWMKDMEMSLDIIWMDEQKRIIHIEENIAPETFPTIFRPEQPASYVLEMPARFIERYGIKQGTYASW